MTQHTYNIDIIKFFLLIDYIQFYNEFNLILFMYYTYWTY